ncbi:MAG: type II toxin-antitoxin system RelB/DinJ family antitoxin [Actinomycetaceae bacterium]|nr:type II toxin-antitoxin system RelB/DinJ family antitoxin [Actinomycetaceae bacterium]
MKIASVNARINEDVKAEAEHILEAMGISRATAIDIFTGK